MPWLLVFRRVLSYKKTVGKKSWELDALKPEVPMRIAEEAVQQYLDEDA